MTEMISDSTEKKEQEILREFERAIKGKNYIRAELLAKNLGRAELGCLLFFALLCLRERIQEFLNAQ